MVICDILTKEENAKHLQSSMLTQKIFGGMFWAIFSFLAFVSVRALVIAKQANALFERALAHQPLQEQLPF
ncbi:DUF6216 family protein [Pseudomonas sp. MM211]|uniref:DUF6216 family protein n=1 Tax=Pseudomonas sp. MM211 TaxID=2866808 RepID=UPI003FA6CA01